MRYLIFVIARICANCCFMGTNESYISQPFTINRPLKCPHPHRILPQRGRQKRGPGTLQVRD